ncbi:MAG TPA: amino acid permease, partial [Wenzhouxiangella sp.]|nr:amino acid permease [Wenzhouxiangella sp.]
TVTTIIGITALLAVLWALRDSLMAFPGALLSGPAGDTGGEAGAVAFSFGFDGFGMLFAGAILAVYSFIGFGDMAQTAEEVRDVKRNLPRAMMISLGIVFVFYMLIAMALVGTGQLEAIADASAPLVKAVELSGWPGLPLAIASLFVIVNVALTQIIAASRLLLDIARDGRGAPPVFARVSDKTDTPIPATLVIAGTVVTLALLVPLKSLAEMTSFAILVVFVGVNLSLIRMKRRSQPEEVPDIPIAIPVIGALAAAGALAGQVIQFASGGS